jgi:hypothetical protein
MSNASTKARKPEKLTKTERRIVVRELAKKLLQKAIAAGYRLWQPGEIVEMSDRSYLVRKDGSWKRLDPGAIVRIGRVDYEVGPRGKLKFLKAHR